MATLLKLRLDEKTHKRIALFAHQNKISSSEVVRRAVESWACLHLPYEAVSDLIGVVRGGNPKRSEQTGRRLTKLLKGTQEPFVTLVDAKTRTSWNSLKMFLVFTA